MFRTQSLIFDFDPIVIVLAQKGIVYVKFMDSAKFKTGNGTNVHLLLIAPTLANLHLVIYVRGHNFHFSAADSRKSTSG